MKKNVFKVITLLTVLAMVFALTACGKKGGKEKTVYRTLDEIQKSGTEKKTVHVKYLIEMVKIRQIISF